MFIHLGEDIIIRTDEVIAIFDYDLFQNDVGNITFVEETLKDRKYTDIGHQMIKSIVLTDDHLYYSPFSPATLRKRSHSTIPSP